VQLSLPDYREFHSLRQSAGKKGGKRDVKRIADAAGRSEIAVRRFFAECALVDAAGKLPHASLRTDYSKTFIDDIRSVL
jgi:hypothetical protein